MAFVTIPTASYVNTDDGKNLLLPELLPLAADFNQQCKLWRFYCTCLDLGCPNYKLEDFHKSNMSHKDKYLYWVKDWKKHYFEISELTRSYKRAKNEKWFYADEQSDYRRKIRKHASTKTKLEEHYFSDDTLFYRWHLPIIFDNLEKLKMSAQHLLNARYTAKLACHAFVLKSRNQ